MKKELEINEQYIKDLFSCWPDEEIGITFQEYIYGDFCTDPTIGAMLDVNGFSYGKENLEEFEAMNEEEQKAELAARLDVLYKRAAEIVGMTEEEFTTIKK